MAAVSLLRFNKAKDLLFELLSLKLLKAVLLVLSPAPAALSPAPPPLVVNLCVFC